MSASSRDIQRPLRKEVTTFYTGSYDTVKISPPRDERAGSREPKTKVFRNTILYANFKATRRILTA